MNWTSHIRHTLGRIFSLSWAGQNGGGTAETEQPLGLIDHFLSITGADRIQNDQISRHNCVKSPAACVCDIHREILSC